MPAIVPIIIAAGTVGGAAIAAKGNTKAAQTSADASKEGSADQLKAAEEALQFQKEQYNNTQKAINPYQNMGAGALAALGSGLGVTPGNIPLSQIPQDRPVGQTSSGFLSPDDFTAFKNQVMNGPTNAFAQPTPQANTWMNPQPQANSAQSLSQSSVKMRSPDGKDVQDVPAQDVPYYLSKQATVVQS